MSRVVVTGFGLKSPEIDNCDQFHRVLHDGIYTYQLIKGLGPNGANIVCGVIDKPFSKIGQANYRHYPRVSRLAIAAAVDAVESAQIQSLMTQSHKAMRVAVIIGTTAGGLNEIEAGVKYSASQQYSRFPSMSAGLGNFHSVASSVAAHFRVHGITLTLSSGCTAGSDAIVLGKLLLESGQADICIVGGADSPLSSYSIFSFAKQNAIASNVDVENTGVPFSTSHNGFVMSEGSGVLVLERENDAQQRGATIYGVITNACSNNDGISIHRSDTSGDLMYRSLSTTVGSSIPSYVNSQALGLHVNDMVDRIVHLQLFGREVPITSIKGMIGHSFAAIGVIQVISALISFEHNFIPPTIKTQGEGYEDLPIVYKPIYGDIASVAVISHGLGGNNTCLLVDKYS